MITFFGDLPSSAFFTASSASTAASISAVAGLARHCDVGALSPVDLHRQRHRVLDQQIALDLRPGACGDQASSWPSAAQHSSARCGIIGLKELHKNVNRFAHGPAKVRLPRAGNGPLRLSRFRQLIVTEAIGEFMDRRHTNIKVQLFDVIGDCVKRLMGRLAERQRGRGELGGRAAGADCAISAASPTSRHSRCTNRQAPCTPRSRPFHIALGRRIRQHEPARNIGAVFRDDVVGVDSVALSTSTFSRAARSRPARRSRSTSRAGRRPGLDLDFRRRRPFAVQLGDRSRAPPSLG